MKQICYLIIVAFLAISCQNSGEKSDKKTEIETPSEMKTEEAMNFTIYKVDIKGMTCTHCEETIVEGVQKIDGVELVKASHVDGLAKVKFDSNKSDTTALKQAIETAGYKVVSVVEIEDTKTSE